MAGVVLIVSQHLAARSLAINASSVSMSVAMIICPLQVELRVPRCSAAGMPDMGSGVCFARRRGP